MYQAYITQIKNLRPHPNADRLDLGECFGNTVCVGRWEYAEGDLVVYFPTDGQLSEEFCAQHNLVRRKDDAGNNVGGYLDPAKRNVKAISLRGEKSDGLVMPLKSLEYTGVDIRGLEVGFCFTAVNGKEICCKYIPRRSGRAAAGGANRTRKKKANQNIFPYFVEHIDTPQLRFNMSMFKPGDIICLTEKVHGTSSRNGYALTQPKKKWFHRLFRLEPKVHYSNIAGTRRTLVSPDNAGYYGTNEFRDYWASKFIGKLHPGEQVFGEIAGFYDTNCPIMSQGNNHKLKDKNFVTLYGDTTTFSYGCSADGEGAPLNRYFIYRMTYTTPEGYVIEYPWDLVRLRAEQMGFEVVPELERFIYTTEEDFMSHITQWLDAPSFLDARHVREGVVVRALNASSFKVAKEKSWSFKVLEGIIKEVSETPDLEEIEDLL
jgi:hypothetical protein